MHYTGLYIVAVIVLVKFLDEHVDEYETAAITLFQNFVSQDLMNVIVDDSSIVLFGLMTTS